MKSFILMLGLVLFFTPCKDAKHIEDVNSDPNTQNKSTYIPKDIEDCFRELRTILTDEELEEFKESDDVIVYHFGLGMWIRNNWGLWSGSRLSKYFNDMGVLHPDDMSGIILTCFHRHLNGQDIKFKEEVKNSARVCMEAILGYYFGGAVVFSILSGLICCVYMGLITDYMSARYTDEYQKIFSSYSWSPTKVRKIFKDLKNFRDDKLKSLARKGFFWFYCCISIILTAPIGMMIYIIICMFSKE